MVSATPRQECVLYHTGCDPYALLLRSLVDPRSDMFSIAKRYGCKLELRPARWRQTFNTNYLPPSGAGEDGSCTAAVLVGGDRERMAKARDDIWKTVGVESISGGWVEIGKGKHYFQ